MIDSSVRLNSKITNLGMFSFQEQHKNQAMCNQLEDLRLLHLNNWLYLKKGCVIIKCVFLKNNSKTPLSDCELIIGKHYVKKVLTLFFCQKTNDKIAFSGVACAKGNGKLQFLVWRCQYFNDLFDTTPL